MTRPIALATHRGLPELAPDDRLLGPALARRGLPSFAAVWDDPSIPWGEVGAVVVRSTWDYHRRTAEFLAWIARVEDLGVTILNPPATLRWNHDKRYLRDLADAGADIVPTAWILPEEPRALGDVLADRGWDRAVVKPAISASAHETFLVDGASLSESESAWSRLLRQGVVLVQPFIEEVANEGEWSLCFFSGAFSHAVCKRPLAGDFRSQAEFGGELRVAEPPSGSVEAARRLLDASQRRWIYARVDGVMVGGRFLLMELELIEPGLFLDLEPEAPGRFAGAIAAEVGD